jgi:hypothetical protein
MTSNDFIEAFKVMLVREYCWNVTNAAAYNNDSLSQYHEKGFSVQEAYWEIFDVPNNERELHGEEEADDYITTENGGIKTIS